MDLYSLFQDKIKDFNINNNKTAIGVSGGIDSITLLHLMITWTSKKKYPTPVALTVDHMLRLESHDESKFAAYYAKEIGVKESFVLKWEKQNIKGNIQLQARKARYRLLINWCKNNNIKYLLVAHNKDDQIETFLLKLERGSGIDGLSCIEKKLFFNGIYIIRPLLNFSRDEIKKYAELYSLKWIEDKSNQDIKYRRNLYRILLKMNHNRKVLTNRICLTALHINRAKKALIYYTLIVFNKYVNFDKLGFIEIKLSKFYELPEEIALRVLIYSIMAMSGKYYKPRYNKIIKIFNEISKKNNNFYFTFYKCKIRRYNENILIIKGESKIKELLINLPLDKDVIWDNRFSCTIIYSKKCSVTITHLNKNCKIPDFLKNYNCCSEVFYSIPIIMKDKKIIAYPNTSFSNKENICKNKLQYITNSIVKQNLINLINI